jgi:hypothetical protein
MVSRSKIHVGPPRLITFETSVPFVDDTSVPLNPKTFAGPPTAEEVEYPFEPLKNLKVKLFTERFARVKHYFML